MGGWEKFKILVKKKKWRDKRCKIINGGGDKSINQTVEKKGRKKVKETEKGKTGCT